MPHLSAQDARCFEPRSEDDFLAARLCRSSHALDFATMVPGVSDTPVGRLEPTVMLLLASIPRERLAIGSNLRRVSVLLTLLPSAKATCSVLAAIRLTARAEW
jgi:hypothetical protein